MAIPLNQHLICMAESELIQWRARGQLHLSPSRLYFSDSFLDHIFACSAMFKLDDAKARLIAIVDINTISDQNRHPFFPGLFSLPLNSCLEVAPVLPQYRERLVRYGFKVANWSAQDEWMSWLLKQSIHERYCAIKDVLYGLGLLNNDQMLDDSGLVRNLIRMVIRPAELPDSCNVYFSEWAEILFRRDEIIKSLRFGGHVDRITFLAESINSLYKDKIGSIDFGDCLKVSEDRGWNHKDLNDQFLIHLRELDVLLKDKGLRYPPAIYVAAYLRIFEEISYGACDWRMIINLLRYLKSRDPEYSFDALPILIFASLSAEDIYTLNLRDKFNLPCDDIDP